MQRSSHLSRRDFLRGTVGVAGSLAALPVLAAERPGRILLRSSWQTVNIGDIAHTPGVLALLEKHLPDIEVRLWPSKIDNGVEEMLLRRFPKLAIVQGRDRLQAAFA
ncbi:MAG TPA: twin-arginine translocation signal domain-containing protein, partial [Planctomycetaceae bacterium]|nr:twin-arginine translocation signal domain-containing protein [Planctomycetaceae bacterium]